MQIGDLVREDEDVKFDPVTPRRSVTRYSVVEGLEPLELRLVRRFEAINVIPGERLIIRELPLQPE